MNCGRVQVGALFVALEHWVPSGGKETLGEFGYGVVFEKETLGEFRYGGKKTLAPPGASVFASLSDSKASWLRRKGESNAKTVNPPSTLDRNTVRLAEIRSSCRDLALGTKHEHLGVIDDE